MEDNILYGAYTENSKKNELRISELEKTVQKVIQKIESDFWEVVEW